ncbi:hypothetical protein [Nonomuraea candida]|uniref:hypothetical protein n=1 Tax=Nonomuraea candida TaxID=359159 RepID=UPI0005B9107C|nr:hypothetical protein [Nonomuraea candida]
MAHVEPLREDDPAAVGAYRLLGRLGSGGRGTVSSRPLLPSITWKRAGAYRVVFEVVSPGRMQKSMTVNICDFEQGW